MTIGIFTGVSYWQSGEDVYSWLQTLQIHGAQLAPSECEWCGAKTGGTMSIEMILAGPPSAKPITI